MTCFVFDSAANNSFVKEFNATSYKEAAKELMSEYDMNFLKEEFNIVAVRNTHSNVVEFTYADGHKSHIVISLCD